MHCNKLQHALSGTYPRLPTTACRDMQMLLLASKTHMQHHTHASGYRRRHAGQGTTRNSRGW